MRHLAGVLVASFVLVSAVVGVSPANANTVTIFNGAYAKGTLSDLGVPVTFLGYASPGVLDNLSPYTAITTTVNPADAATLVPI